MAAFVWQMYWCFLFCLSKRFSKSTFYFLFKWISVQKHHESMQNCYYQLCKAKWHMPADGLFCFKCIPFQYAAHCCCTHIISSQLPISAYVVWEAFCIQHYCLTVLWPRKLSPWFLFLKCSWSLFVPSAYKTYYYFFTVWSMFNIVVMWNCIGLSSSSLGL